MSYNDKLAINGITEASATTDNYVKTDFGIKVTDEETKNVISATFGVIKNNLEALWYAVGLEPNVNVAYQKTMMDPNKCIGCGICTTRCMFDAIHLHREIPGASVMRASEDKLKYILPNMVKQSIKVKFAKKK